ncbi:TetR/AcrR family transcriptional regulator [Nocardioides sp. REDSEA-S30_B4]|jgi:AcrR family transcriptional regulator|uniref:TetR/AcrR family transcriptional regulator n=1 Tax=Nocardioides sp. REDSEA-S30_B4 TaxID=1811552 RepID=UPI000A5FA381|nr:TetR/AcrR family transcriptional regulator [Nocardioides sp. REDSEA-S30_B4]
MRDQEGPRPGRPRQADVSGRILTAARELIAARSWERISLDEVATRAGVAKTTLYRRWRSKDELAVATLEHALGPLPAATSVRAAVGWLAERVRDPGTRHVLVTLTSLSARDPDLRTMLRSRLRDPYVASLRDEQATREASATLAFDLVVGTLLHRAAMTGGITDGDVADVSDVAEQLMSPAADLPSRDAAGAP